MRSSPRNTQRMLPSFGLALWMAQSALGQTLTTTCPDPCGSLGTLDATSFFVADDFCLAQNPRFANLCAALDSITGSSCSAISGLFLNADQCERLPFLIKDCCVRSSDADPTENNIGTPCRSDPCGNFGEIRLGNAQLDIDAGCLDRAPTNLCIELLETEAELGGLTCLQAASLEVPPFQCDGLPAALAPNCCQNGVLCPDPCGPTQTINPFANFQASPNCNAATGNPGLCSQLAGFNGAPCSAVANQFFSAPTCASLPAALSVSGCCRGPAQDRPGTDAESFALCGLSICEGEGPLIATNLFSVPLNCDQIGNEDLCDFLRENFRRGATCAEVAASDLFFESECALLPPIVEDSCCGGGIFGGGGGGDDEEEATPGPGFIAFLSALFAALFGTIFFD